jgi:hypothetical protein
MNGVVEMQRLKDRKTAVRETIQNLTSHFGGLWREMESANAPGQERIQTRIRELTEELDSLRVQLHEISILINTRTAEALAKPRQMGGTRKHR